MTMILRIGKRRRGSRRRIQNTTVAVTVAVFLVVISVIVLSSSSSFWHRNDHDTIAQDDSYGGKGRRRNFFLFVSSFSFSTIDTTTTTSRHKRRWQHYSYYTATTTTSTSTTLFMAKGDGKKKRPKQSPSSTSPSPPTSSSSAAPPRVSNDSPIPIRRQIQYGKINKALRESNTGGAFRQANNKKYGQRTKYRRTWDEEEIEQASQARKRKGQDPDWQVVLNQTKAAPLVIVDGYNIIYKWPRLKKHMIKGDTARARQLLVDDLENLRSNKGWRIEVVFDGAGRGRRSGSNNNGPLGDGPRGSGSGSITKADRSISKEVSKFGVRSIYTGAGVEADSYIEERCARAKNVTAGSKTGMFIVATDDAMIRIAGESAGALCMGADRFVTELKSVKQVVAHRVEAAMAKVNGQPMRPEKLWGTHTPMMTSVVAAPPVVVPSSSSSNTTAAATAPAPVKGAQQVDEGKFVYRGRFGRGNLIIEDKRKNKKSKDEQG